MPASHPHQTEARRARKIVIVLVALLVAGTQLFTGPSYRGPFRWFITGYAMDILLPFSSYFLLLAAAETLTMLRHWWIKVSVVFAVMSCAEVAQYLGVPIFGQTFDPWDLVAFIGGALMAAATDQILLPCLFDFWRHGTSTEP